MFLDNKTHFSTCFSVRSDHIFFHILIPLGRTSEKAPLKKTCSVPIHVFCSLPSFFLKNLYYIFFHYHFVSLYPLPPGIITLLSMSSWSPFSFFLPSYSCLWHICNDGGKAVILQPWTNDLSMKTTLKIFSKMWEDSISDVNKVHINPGTPHFSASCYVQTINLSHWAIIGGFLLLYDTKKNTILICKML